MTQPTIGDLVEVAAVETVVRLDGRTGRLAELVLTDDVAASLEAILEAAQPDGGGAGFFVVAPFGSGKSHFLAAVGELLADPAQAGQLPGWSPRLRQAAGGARPTLPVGIPLVEYRASASLEDVVAQRVCRTLDMPRPQTDADRSEAWNGILAAAGDRGHAGLVLLLDELSEFLRAKEGPALTEDLRFLQFLGEWSSTRPVIIVGALQENIEEVANVSQRELARIRDRYRRSLTLSMRHVEDLVHGRLVTLRPDAEQWIERAHADIHAAFPDAAVPLERLRRCYPLHPDTLSVLEGLKFLLSQQRGVVDFVCTEVRTEVGRGYAELITPDRVWDHFRDRIHERAESNRLADVVVPYFERALPELVDEDDRDLALRTIKLLCLLSASPLERPRTAAELAGMLLCRVSDLDPRANVTYLEQAVLEPMVSRGAYVVAASGPPATYSVEVEADAAVVVAHRLDQARAELRPGDRRQIATLVALGSAPQLPLQLMAETGPARREFIWEGTSRSITTVLARVVELTGDDAAAMIDRARQTGAAGCLIVGEVELDDHSGALDSARLLARSAERLAVWLPADPSPAERAGIADLHARRVVLAQARAAGEQDLVEVLERAGDADQAQAREILRRLYFEGAVLYPAPDVAVDLATLAGVAFDRQLPALADPLLRAVHPRHREVAPRSDLVGDRILRDLVNDVIPHGRLGPAALARGGARSYVENYLVPAGLATLRANGMVVAPDAGRSPAVAETLRAVGDGEPVAATSVVQSLAEGPVGLTEPEAILVLNACVQAGLVEMWRGRQRYAEPFVAVTGRDRLSAGELAEPSLRDSIARLGPIVGPGPWEPWSSSTQRSASDYARAWLDARREEWREVQAGLTRLRDVPALGGVDETPVVADAALVEAVIEATSPGPDEPSGVLGGLRRLAAAVDDIDTLLAAANRLRAVARFLRDDLRRVEEIAAYVTHPDLKLPDGDEVLGALRDQVLDLLHDLLALAASDRVNDLLSANREFRAAYRATYLAAHDAHYAAVTTQDVEEVRSQPPYRALARLASIGAVAVPDDRVKVDRLLAAAAPQLCTKATDVELEWKPRCRCGFALGDPQPVLDAGAIIATAKRGVEQYLAELHSDETKDRLDRGAADLRALGRQELAGDVERLLTVTDPEDIASLLTGEVPGVVRDVLTGGQLIVTRDLAALREDLIGRRYPKRRLLELLAAWVDPTGEIAPGTFIELADTGEATATPTAPSPTVAALARRFPTIAAALPAHQPADAFWLAAWWQGRPSPPAWLPARLLEEPLGAAAAAILDDPAARDELASLDAQVAAGTVLGDEMAAVLDLGGRPTADVAAVLADESLFRHPVRLAADQLLRRVATDWQQVARLDGTEETGRRHPLMTGRDMEAAGYLIDAARHLAVLERRFADASGKVIVEDLYPGHYAPVRELTSRAEAACAADAVIGPATVDAFRAGSEHLLHAVDAAFAVHAGLGFPGCLAIWDVGDKVVAPLLSAHGRVAVLLVDAMRADVAERIGRVLTTALAGRQMDRRWAVVPAPTRTAEAVEALALGRPVPGGSASAPHGSTVVPFNHLGYEARVLLGADRDHNATELRELWSSGPPLSIAVATGVDERLHRTSVELCGLLDEAASMAQRRLAPSLGALPATVPLVVLADHGFRENPSWGHGPEGRYLHGGTSLEECVVPILVFGPASDAR